MGKEKDYLVLVSDEVIDAYLTENCTMDDVFETVEHFLAEDDEVVLPLDWISFILPKGERENPQLLLSRNDEGNNGVYVIRNETREKLQS